jgi:hypothetical protein
MRMNPTSPRKISIDLIVFAKQTAVGKPAFKAFDGGFSETEKMFRFNTLAISRNPDLYAPGTGESTG